MTQHAARLARRVVSLEAWRRSQPSPAERELWRDVPRQLSFGEICAGQQALEAYAGDPFAAVLAGDPVVCALVAVARARRGGVPMPPYDGV